MPSFPQLTLSDLFNLTGPKPKAKAKNSRVIAIKRRKNIARFSFVVRSTEPYSSSEGHIVSFMYPNLAVPWDKMKFYPQLTPANRRAKIHCTCQAWKFWGSAFLATREGYELDAARERRPANIRDPAEENYVCKHAIRVAQEMRATTFPQLVARFTPGPGQTTAAYAALVRPIIASVMAHTHLAQEVDDVLFAMDDDNFEDVLESQGMIVSENDDG